MATQARSVPESILQELSPTTAEYRSKETPKISMRCAKQIQSISQTGHWPTIRRGSVTHVTAVARSISYTAIWCEYRYIIISWDVRNNRMTGKICSGNIRC